MLASVGSAAQHWWALLLIGICAGILSGMLGLGSGTLIIPALALLLALPQKSAQGMCLAAMVPMVLVGAIRYKMNPEIEVNMVRVALLAAGGVAGALAGVEIAIRLSGGALRKIFACFIVAIGLRMLIAPTGRRPEAGVASQAADEASIRPGAGADADRAP